MKVLFLDPCVLRALPGDGWVLAERMRATVVDDESQDVESIEVPAGFETDLASVPRFPGVFLLLGGTARASSVLHDWLYSEKETTADGPPRFRRDRSWCDRVFLAAMEAEGEPAWRRGVMWLGVRLFGGMARRAP